MAMEPEERDRLTRVEIKLENLEREVMEIRQDTAEIKRLLEQGRGGWRVLAVIGAVGGMILGAVIMRVVGKLIQ